MNCKRSFYVLATAACLLASPLARSADAPAPAKPVPPVLVLVPEPRLAPLPMPLPTPPARAMALPQAPAEVVRQLPSGRSHTVVRGDTLDRVIQKTMADSPLKPAVIRQAFMALNPQAFPNGRVTGLKVGAVLQVPDSAQLLRSVLLPVLEGAEAAAVVRSATPQTAADERRRWVRFP